MMGDMDLGLHDKVYVVTGAARGLGRATADALVAEGAKVVISGRHQDTLDKAVADLAPNAVSVVADNADPDTPARLIAAATDTPVTGVTDDEWTTAFESVFLGAIRVAREAAAALQAGGSITFVLSSSVRSPLPNMAVSNGLRPGLAMVAKTLADELGPRGIRVNGLLPGRIETERLLELDAATGDADQARAQAAARIPLGRQGDPAEFGRVAAFLMSPAAGFVSGVMVPVDGGMLRAL